MVSVRLFLAVTATDVPTLSREQARSFYDRFGAKQDQQGFYENAAIRDLLAHAGFEAAQAVCEVGCGTGRFAETLLEAHLPETARYAGWDVSTTMVDLTRQRLARFAGRAEVFHTDGSPRLPAADATFDRVVSNYVLDLLSLADIRLLLAEAHRLLTQDGRLCLISLTHGITLLSRLVIGVWMRVHRLRP
ncbi:MAG: class I SAM-dependent methyltransferase, partial [Candidatus Binatia bacterium]